MSDIVERLRKWCHAVNAASAQDLMDEAADKIERLQRSVTDWQLEAEVHRKRASAAVAEIARLRLTDAEREAVELFATLNWTSLRWSKVEKNAATLRKLLERLA
jgi:hypothetical protein